MFEKTLALEFRERRSIIVLWTINNDKYKPRFVETLRKRGYRFIGKLE